MRRAWGYAVERMAMKAVVWQVELGIKNEGLQDGKTRTQEVKRRARVLTSGQALPGTTRVKSACDWSTNSPRLGTR
jgi:hypothetical protein